MKKITTLMCAVALWCSAQAQAPALHFGRDGKFRIAQFTDVHLDLGTPYRRAQAEKTIAQMRYILDAEHPDLVVFTGDVVTGKPAAEAWHRVLEPVAERNLPFCVVLGNHDAEQDLTRAEIGRIVTSYAGTLNTLGAGGELADVVLEIAGTTQPAALLYCLDSHDYSTIPSIDGYGWFTQEQVGWYRARSAAYTAANGGKPLPALAFFHIALPEYVAAWRNPDNTHVGRAAEDECPGALNPGMFAAMAECGDVMGREGYRPRLRPFFGRRYDLQQPAAGGAHPRADRGRTRLRDVDTRARRPDCRPCGIPRRESCESQK